MNAFDPVRVFAAIEQYRANIMAGVPTMYVYMLLIPELRKYDISSMQCWSCGSAPLTLDTWNRFKEAFGYEITEGWG